MKWRGRQGSGNMEDRRGMSGGKLAVGGGAIGLIVLLINMFMGGDSTAIMNDILQQQNQGTQQEIPLSEEDKELGQMVSVVLKDTEDVWAEIFAQNGKTYQNAGLVLFRQGVNTSCGTATSAAGPFYCPADQKVYMDLIFFEELENRFGAKGGDFAIAYVIAHEIGHHVQTLLGTSADVRRRQQNLSEADANKLSVALELQADFYAGIWTHYNEKKEKFLEQGDIEEALSAASAVGDDAIQKKTQGHVTPDSFTHGSSEERMYWFNLGYTTGDLSKADTFRN